MIVRRLARPLLSGVFIQGGVEALRNPGPRVEMAKPVVERITATAKSFMNDDSGDGSSAPVDVPTDPELYVKVNAGVMIGAGLLLSAGKLPRLSSAVLAGTLLPTTIAGHRFWEAKDAAERAKQQTQFFKNIGLIGGLILAAVDTEGRPGVSWRVSHGAKHAGREAGRARRHATREAKLAAKSAKDNVASHLPG